MPGSYPPLTMSRNPFSAVQLYILAIFLICLPFHGNTQNNDPNRERTILLGLKQHWSNPSSINHWTPSSDPCTWPEITCTDGSVTGLKIINGSIAQTIPPSICDLNNLTYVYLQGNNIPGLFPTVLYNCSKLEYLDLSSNHFVGTIPDDINRLSPQIHFLNLEANNFTSDIPAAMGDLPSLRSINLAANLFSGSFPSELGNLSNLEELNLNYNAFTPQWIPSSFTKLKKLRNLWMIETKLIGKIPDYIGNMSALESLDLSVNNLTGSVPNGLFLLKNLAYLFLNKNRLSGSIPQTVEALKLQVLDLSNNILTGTIPDDFGKLTSLTDLALFFNQLSGNVPVSIGRLPMIVNIGLFSNNLSGELPPDFGRYSMLQIVRAQNNHFSGKIPDGLWTSKSLTTLMLSNNLFSGQLPDKVGSQLLLLELMNNRFSGPIPDGISLWETLTVFKASNNLLSGGIPQELTALPSIFIVLLDGNQLSGNLPSTIVSWKSLSILNLSGNQLSGEIPASLGLLPVLSFLDLSGNELSGQIPPEIGLLKLSSLNLSSNRLSGRIPSEFENAAFGSSFLNNPGLCSNIPSLGLSCCHAETRKSNKLSSQFIAAVVSSIGGAFLVAFYIIYVCRSYRKQKHMSHPTNWTLTPFQRLNFTGENIFSGLKVKNVIGKGGSGRVYLVPINRSGEYVAVKRIWDKVKLDEKLEKEFLAEVHILGTIRHSNIVKLLCCISSEDSKLLVYEYVENGSLHKWLHGRMDRSDRMSGSVHHVVLDWPQRLQIAIGAARGLCYMHHHLKPPIIHRDVKSSNILLDSEFNAKIADFGLARMLFKPGEPNTMSVVAGSFGYIAPEYAQTTRVNEKVDVYSFGVVLLELVTGRPADQGDENSSLAQWAWNHVQERKPIIDALDEDIKEPHYLEGIEEVLNLGLICTSADPSTRPAMNYIMNALRNCSERLPRAEMANRNERDVAPLLQN